MGPNHGPRCSSPRDTLDVRDGGLGNYRNAPAGLMQAPAEIHIFGEHEVPLIKSTHGLKRSGPSNEKRAAHPIDLAIAAR